MATVRLMHFLNQFFAGEGGEEKADLPLGTKGGAVGPGRRLQALLGDTAEIVVTVYCGDNYFPAHSKEVLDSIVEIARDRNVGMIVGGPSFGAGRYGFASVEACHALATTLGLPGVTGMHPENPGVDMYRGYRDRTVYAVPTAEGASGMEDALAKMAALASKLATGATLGSAAEGGYMPRGLRLLELRPRNGAERAVDLLLARAAGGQFDTEIPIDIVEPIPIPPRVKSLKDAYVALGGTAGITLTGNPDAFRGFRSTAWNKYSIEELNSMQDVQWEVMHGGYNTQFMKENPNYGLPLDVCREMEKQGVFAKLYPYHFSTTGVLGLITDMQVVGKEMVQAMKAEGIDAAIMVST
ncbi:MAG: glycine/betaine/sarcosine/D-proline family reductase selenoprotein B [Chloroflexi bacterium]|nr:glycine/betaine/sarcosine/D-proline family reductase selenoprotein B [Chloroflexota bacterium]